MNFFNFFCFIFPIATIAFGEDELQLYPWYQEDDDWSQYGTAESVDDLEWWPYSHEKSSPYQETFVKTCGPAPIIDHAIIDETSIDGDSDSRIGDYIWYRCLRGWQLDANAAVFCHHDGTWNPKLPTCEPQRSRSITHSKLEPISANLRCQQSSDSYSGEFDEPDDCHYEEIRWKYDTFLQRCKPVMVCLTYDSIMGSELVPVDGGRTFATKENCIEDCLPNGKRTTVYHTTTVGTRRHWQPPAPTPTPRPYRQPSPPPPRNYNPTPPAPMPYSNEYSLSTHRPTPPEPWYPSRQLAPPPHSPPPMRSTQPPTTWKPQVTTTPNIWWTTGKSQTRRKRPNVRKHPTTRRVVSTHTPRAMVWTRATTRLLETKPTTKEKNAQVTKPTTLYSRTNQNVRNRNETGKSTRKWVPVWHRWKRTSTSVTPMIHQPDGEQILTTMASEATTSVSNDLSVQIKKKGPRIAKPLRISGGLRGPKCLPGLANKNHSSCLEDSKELIATVPFPVEEPMKLHYLWLRTARRSRKQASPRVDPFLVWSDELAITAERHASQCLETHDNMSERVIPRLGLDEETGVGQNICWASWDESIKECVAEWALRQRRSFVPNDLGADITATFEAINDTSLYTAIPSPDMEALDATMTSRRLYIGCGKAHCRPRSHEWDFTIVCNYGPNKNNFFVQQGGWTDENDDKVLNDAYGENGDDYYYEELDEEGG